LRANIRSWAETQHPCFGVSLQLLAYHSLRAGQAVAPTLSERSNHAPRCLAYAKHLSTCAWILGSKRITQLLCNHIKAESFRLIALPLSTYCQVSLDRNIPNQKATIGIPQPDDLQEQAQKNTKVADSIELACPELPVLIVKVPIPGCMEHAPKDLRSY